MKLKKIANIFILFLFCFSSTGQTLTEQLILTDNKDSIYLKARNISFDREGNYCFTIYRNNQNYFITNKDTIGGFILNGLSSNGGEISYTKSYSDPKEKPYYYKNTKGAKVFGTAIGEIEFYITSNTKENIALLNTLNDSVYYYINGELILKKKKDQEKYNYFENQWVSFSENGNRIYYIKPDSINYLYVNDRIIDSSKFGFNNLTINNDGKYIFSKTERSEDPLGKYIYTFFLHSMDTVIGFVGSILNCKLKENGAYYFCNNIHNNRTDYIAINDMLHKEIEKVSNIILIDKTSYFYSFSEKDKTLINVSGEIYSFDFDEILLPSVDKNGNFAFYGMKDYYLYKFVNGKKIIEPISKYGSRANPIYISTNGESLHYFKTDDSIYLYQDEKLIFEPIQRNTKFLILSHLNVLPFNFRSHTTENGNTLFYLEYDKHGYFVFNGNISKKIIPINNINNLNNQRIGSIVASVFNDNGFFAIQKIGNKKYLIIINNQLIKELDNIDYIVSDNFFFDGESLIFYGLREYSFYQFKISL